MTPLTMQLLMSAAVIVGAGIVLRRFRFEEYPALVCWMVWEVAMQFATFGYRNLTPVMMFVQDGICAAVICEAIRARRVHATLGLQVRCFVCAMAGAKILAGIPALTPMQSAYLCRSYVLWSAFGVLLAVTVMRLARPVLERKVDKVFGIGMTVWVFWMAVGSSFTKGGLGYRFLPYTMATWRAVNFVSYLAVILTVLVMSLAMAASAPARKRAAKTAKGLTRTGLLEMERVA